MSKFFYEYQNDKAFKIEVKEGEKLPLKGKKLSSFLKESKKFPKNEFLSIAEQLLMILDEMRSVFPPVLHRNINPTNIIIKTNWEIALIGFNSEKTGANNYSAPEVSTYPTPKSDLYSVGKVLLDISGNLDENTRKFIKLMIDKNPDNRFKNIKIALNILKQIKNNTINENSWSAIINEHDIKADNNISLYEANLHDEFNKELINLDTIKTYRTNRNNWRQSQGNMAIFGWIFAIPLAVFLINLNRDSGNCGKAPEYYKYDEECNLIHQTQAERKHTLEIRNKKEKAIKDKAKKLGLTGKR